MLLIDFQEQTYSQKIKRVNLKGSRQELPANQ